MATLTFFPRLKMSAVHKLLDDFLVFLRRLFRINNIQISIYDEKISVKVFGRFLHEFDTEGFIKIIPSMKIQIKIITDSTHKELWIDNNSIYDYTIQQVSSINVQNEVTLSFISEDIRGIVKYIDLNKNSYENVSIRIKDNIVYDSTEQHEDITSYDEQCRSVTKSLLNMISYSINGSFRQKCIALINIENTDRSMEEILMDKLKKMDDEQSNQTTPD